MPVAFSMRSLPREQNKLRFLPRFSGEKIFCKFFKIFKTFPFFKTPNRQKAKNGGKNNARIF